MDAFIIYLLKAGICLAFFYLFFKLFLSRETFFAFNRMVVLAGICVCLLLPLVKLNIGVLSLLRPPVEFFGEQAFADATTVVPATDTAAFVEEIPGIAPPLKEYPISFYSLFLIIYVTGCALNLAMLLRSVGMIRRIVGKRRKVIYKGYTVFLVQKNISPFSWGKYIILSESDFRTGADEALQHEIEHIKHFHPIDLVLIELVLLFQWFNPAAWLLRKELRNIHEYQADESVITNGIDATKYQLLLVKKSAGSCAFALANNFNHSKIKKRISMMLKEKSKRKAKLKLLPVLPVLFVATVAFSPDNLPPASVGNPNETVPVEISEQLAYHNPMPTCTKVFGGFGMRKHPITKKRGLHQGYDLMGQGKDTICAAFGGTVSLSGWHHGYGITVIVQHGNGIETLYAHNSENLVKEGEAVKSGQAIAISGNTGQSTEEHLHFEVRKDGKAVQINLATGVIAE